LWYFKSYQLSPFCSLYNDSTCCFKVPLSYIIYSKVGILGKFALPVTTAVYEREGKIHEAESNRTFFIAEPRKKEEEEE